MLASDLFTVTLASTRPSEVRMGSGKGEPVYWAAVIKPGSMIFEIDSAGFNSKISHFRLSF